MIEVIVHGKHNHRSIMDEGTSTCIMSMSCWKAIGSPNLSQSLTTLNDFDGRSYKPCGILNSLQVELGGETVSLEVEVINELLYYNLPLVHTWVYAMATIVLTYFRMIMFPHKGNIVVFGNLIGVKLLT